MNSRQPILVQTIKNPALNKQTTGEGLKVFSLSHLFFNLLQLIKIKVTAELREHKILPQTLTLWIDR